MPHPVQAIRAWCTSHDISNLEILPTASQYVQLIAGLDPEQPTLLRTLLARLFEHFIWLDPPNILVYPIIGRDQLIFAVDLYHCPPENTLHSSASKALVAAAQEADPPPDILHTALATRLIAEVNAFCDSMPEDASTIHDRVQSYVNPCAYSSDEKLVLQFVENLSPPNRALIEDLRTLTNLAHRQCECLEALDIWHHRESKSADGQNQGMCARMSLLGELPYERTRLTVDPIILGEADATPTDTPGTAAESPIQTLAEDLVTIICDQAAPKYRRNEALTQLQNQPESNERDLQMLHAIGGSLDLDSARLLPFVKSANLLVESIVLAKDCTMVTVGLIGLAQIRRHCPDSLLHFRDQRLAASANDKQRDQTLGESYQETVLTWLQTPSPEFIKKICTEVANESRRPDWIAAALQVLDRLEVPEVRHLARLLESHSVQYVAQWATMIRNEHERRDKLAANLSCSKVDADIVDQHSYRTFHMRLELWRQPGYAWSRYLQVGHRSPAWDQLVESAYAAYSFSEGPQPESVSRDLQAAIDAGCQDGMVYYRRAVSVIEDDARAGHRWMEKAVPRLDRYPKNPYAISASDNLSRWHYTAGRLDEARTFMETVLASDQAPMSSEHHMQLIVDRTVVRNAFDKLDPDHQPLDTGDLQAYPSVTHTGQVTSVLISPNGESLVSTDDQGHVQISSVERGDFGRVIPIDSRCVHEVGSCLAGWLSDEQLITGGTDGTVNKISIVNGHFEAPEPVTWSAGGITALHAEDGSFLLGTEEGWVELRPATADSPSQLIGNGSAPIISLRTHGNLILARDVNGNMDLWTRDDLTEAIWTWRHEGYALVFAEFLDSSRLIFANDQGACWCLDITSGKVVPMMQFASAPPPAFAAFHTQSESAFYGSRDGSMRINRQPPASGTIIAHNSLAMVDVSFEHGLIAHADAANTLAINCFTPIPSQAL